MTAYLESIPADLPTAFYVDRIVSFFLSLLDAKRGVLLSNERTVLNRDEMYYVFSVFTVQSCPASHFLLALRNLWYKKCF